MSATKFWIGLMTTPDHLLAKADPSKLAAKYQIPHEWAEAWLATWIGRER